MGKSSILINPWVFLILILLAQGTRAQISNGPVPPGYTPPILGKIQNPIAIVGPLPSSGNDNFSRRNSIDSLLQMTQKSATGFGETATMKFVYKVKAPAKVYLVDTNLYKYHIDYATQVLAYKKSLDSFNKNYSGAMTTREFVLGTLIFLKDARSEIGYRGLFEIWNGDNLDINGLRKVMTAVQMKMPSGLTLQFHPMSLDQEKMAQENMESDQYALTKDLVGDRKFLIFNAAEAVGYLKFSNDEESKPDLLDLTTIAVFNHVPNDIGLVGGVITAEPQTPLSHVNVKSMNRKTMNIFLKNAKDILKQYEGKPVRITLKSDGPEIALITDENGNIDTKKADAEIANFWKKRRPKLDGTPQFIIDPKYDSDFIPLYDYYTRLPDKLKHSALIQRVGAKAANLGLLNALTLRLSLPGVSSPQTLGVPFNFYEQFMNFKQKGLIKASPETETTPLTVVEQILNEHDLLNADTLHPTEKIRETLQQVKEIYLRAQVPQPIIEAFRRAIIEDPESPVHITKHARLRLRSSTNSEDLDGFTGAGLYDSDGFNLYKKNEDGTYDRAKPRSWAKIESDIRKILPALYSSV